MDDGFVPWPKVLNIEIFKTLLNNMDLHIKFTLDGGREETDEHGVICYQSLNFLDITIILFPSGKIETDVYYKATNTHDYLNFDSHHTDHIKKNIPYVLAKRIIVFTSNPKNERINLENLKTWLLKCNYPKNIIKKGFHNAKLQGPAPKPVSTDILPMVATYSSNYDATHIVNQTKRLIANSRDQRIKDVFNESKIVLSLRQPQNLLQHVTKARFNWNADNASNGIFKCSDKTM